MVIFILLAAVFVVVELRSVEPIIPMRLFRNAVFSIGNLFGFLSGVAMFSGIIFLPLYFQGVMGMSPTRSGLALVPAVVGILVASTLSGALITRTGRYKIFPIIGSVILIVALFLLSRLGVATPYWQIAIDALLFGGGLGCTFQTITTAVQNAVAYRDMGAATSSTTFFRTMGSAIGTAVFGAVFSGRLTHHIAEQLTGAPASGAPVNANNIQAIQRLSEPIKHLVLTAFARSLDDVFLACVPLIIVALIVSLFLKEVPLRTGAGDPAAGRREDSVLPVG
ncbi:MAG: MFS transporter [Thermomicrobiales bacterium]